MYSTNENQQLLEAIAQLSEQQIQIVLQFVQRLQPQKTSNPTSTPFDPLTNFVGATHHGSLAQQIDEDLYETDRIAGIFGGDPTVGAWQHDSKPLNFYEAKGLLDSVFHNLCVTVEYQPDQKDK